MFRKELSPPLAWQFAVERAGFRRDFLEAIKATVLLAMQECAQVVSPSKEIQGVDVDRGLVLCSCQT